MGIKRDTADKWFSDCVRERACWTCEDCGAMPERLECAHIIGRRNKRVRQHPDNALCLCNACHRKHSENPLDFSLFVERHLGEGRLQILREAARETVKYNKAFVKECAAHYRQQHKLMIEKKKKGEVGRIEFEGFL